jgi:6-phosphogluconolactonase
MNIEVLPDTEAVAKEAAAIIAQKARLSVSARGRFVLAVSGDSMSLLMLNALIEEQVVWERIQLVQLDECVLPITDPERKATRLRAALLENSWLRPQQIHAMPVESRDLEVAAARYALHLHRIAGSPPILDLVHLTLGQDGRAAALLPGDPVLDVSDQDVSVSSAPDGPRWMTLTYPILNRSRFLLWTAIGEDHADVLRRLRAHDESIPAGRVRGGPTLILADRLAAGHQTRYERVG